jgi:hypothetical protein
MQLHQPSNSAATHLAMLAKSNGIFSVAKKHEGKSANKGAATDGVSTRRATRHDGHRQRSSQTRQSNHALMQTRRGIASSAVGTLQGENRRTRFPRHSGESW